MSTPLIEAVEVFRVRASIRSIWLFVAVTLDSGHVGLGEATLDGRMDGVERQLRGIADRSLGTRAREIRLAEDDHLVAAAAKSAFNQALCDGLARVSATPAAQFFGGERRQEVGLYANINRRTALRTPEGFADSAQLAFDAGFRAFKIAPFDEVTAGAPLSPQDFAMGLRRIEAVRALIGSDARLMVDCHWRFDMNGAASLMDACSALGIHWVECPLPERADTLADIAKLRNSAARRGLLLAGGEDIVGLGSLQPYLDHDCYDVIMPDIKYVGGPLEMLRVAEALEKAGVEFSPHNPSGPVSHAASAEVCAAANQVGLLECQFAETPLFTTLVRGGCPLAARIALNEKRVGFGVTFRRSVLARHLLTQSKVMEDAYDKDN
ncbi:MAG: hypothetical protein LCH61_07715 [Proteobacteria bacterium]|nr:hypothetical protein [Pseudomonadota bacterium]